MTLTAALIYREYAKHFYGEYLRCSTSHRSRKDVECKMQGLFSCATYFARSREVSEHRDVDEVHYRQQGSDRALMTPAAAASTRLCVLA